NLQKGEYFIVSIHREENVDSEQNFTDLMETLNAISEIFGKKVLVSTHPRTRKKLEEINFVSENPSIVFSKPFGFHDYNNLQKNAFCVISDSGTITEEASILNLPAITIRQAHERPEGMDEGVLIMTGLKKERVIESIKIVTMQFKEDPSVLQGVADYKANNVSKKVLRIILSYTDYINRTVWKK
ncbi:MAG: UDP-N-acetylglucosamine 2-epimerase, partial [Flavobacteriaceae bacterium]|nr:UDP-N-acetylglucosamine 2-epimerase [Flavobacteriaceae bacterium]